MKLLDNLPLATLQTVVGWAVILIAYLNNELSVFEAYAAIGANGIAAGAVGYVRNQAGRGIKK